MVSLFYQKHSAFFSLEIIISSPSVMFTPTSLPSYSLMQEKEVFKSGSQPFIRWNLHSSIISFAFHKDKISAQQP